MRIAFLSIVVSFLAMMPSPAQEPPAPLPVLPTKTDTTALRAALRFPLDPPEYRFHFDDTGRFDVFDRSDEAKKRIAAISATLKKNATDAERFDELRLWHHRHNDPAAAKDCAARAARCYGERLRTDPYSADLLTRCGDALIEAEQFADAERRLQRAVAVDPDSWRAWYLLARVQIDSAYAMQAVPAPWMAEDSKQFRRTVNPFPRQLPAEMRVDLPPVDEVAPPPQPIKPAGFPMPSRVVDWNEIERMSGEAGHCLDEALAAGPNEPALRFARCCQRKLAAQALAANEGARTDFDPISLPENTADIHAAISADTTDPELIGVATWFEIMAAQRRLEETDDPAVRRQAYSLVCERIEQLECIAGKAKGPKAARAALLAAHLCRKVGQPFRAGVQVRFAVTVDPDSRAAWEAYLATLAESGPPAGYVAAARKAVDRFDTPAFRLRLADALTQTGDTTAALKELDRIERKDTVDVGSRLAEAALRLRTEGATALPRVNDLLDGVERTLHAQPMLAGQTDCTLLRACSQLIGGNAALGRMLLEDLAKQEPYHPRVKAALAAVE
jgi:tetratricopeptide (TPR) repeat protein